MFFFILRATNEPRRKNLQKNVKAEHSLFSGRRPPAAYNYGSHNTNVLYVTTVFFENKKNIYVTFVIRVAYLW